MYKEKSRGPRTVLFGTPKLTLTINETYNGMGSGKILPKAKLFEIKDFCSVKNFINLLCISFSSILSILDRREMGLQLEHSSLESFLWIWITSATFSFSGNIPVANDMLKMIEICLEYHL